VGDSFRSGDSYRISELCEFVAPDQVQYGYLFYCWSQYDHSNPLLTRHSNSLLTHHSNHLLTSGKTRKSPSSLWGLKKCCPFTFQKKLLSISRFETRTRIFFFKSQSSRRERDFFLNISGFETRARFFSQHLRVRDESEIFSLNISGFETRVRYFLSKSHVSRWERDMQTNFSRSSEKK